MTVSERLREIEERIVESARGAGRRREEITLIAVAKRQPFERIVEALQGGITDLGENTAQGLAVTAEGLAGASLAARWHFVGTLQRNKINAVLPHRPVIHSVDRAKLARALSERAGEMPIEVFVQVNTGREPQKGGVDPDEALDFASTVAQMPGLRLRGLMVIPPANEEPQRHFDALRELSERLARQPDTHDARELSMGMSDDFETAIRCGATAVRIGTALFGQRHDGGPTP